MNELFLVEYPGVVKNVDKMIETLGGESAITSAFKKTNKLDLSRSKNYFMKPLTGEVTKTNGILLKIKKPASSNPNEYVTSVEGIVRKTCRFNKLCDFQFLPIGKSKCNPNEVKDYSEVVMPHKTLIDSKLIADDSVPYFLAPATFSKDDTIRSSGELFKGKKKTKSLQIFVPYNEPIVPKGPSKAILEQFHSSNYSSDDVDIIKKCFEDRPISSRKAVISITQYSKECLQQLLPMVTFTFSQGPWRNLCVRYGYDPRTNPDAAKYQIVESLALNFSINRLTRRNFHLIMKRSKMALMPNNKFVMEEVRSGHIIKEGTLLKSGKINHQLCDIHVNGIQELLHEYMTKLSPICHERFGWFDETFFNKYREILRGTLEQEYKKYDNDKDGDGDGDDNGDSDGAENKSGTDKKLIENPDQDMASDVDDVNDSYESDSSELFSDSFDE